MSGKPDSERIDEENPEWTEEIFRRARPAHEMLPKIFDSKIVDNLLQPKRGRPSFAPPSGGRHGPQTPAIIIKKRVGGLGGGSPPPRREEVNRY